MSRPINYLPRREGLECVTNCAREWRYLLYFLAATSMKGQHSHNPATGFNPKASVAIAEPANLADVIPSTQHGNANGGVDYGYTNVGVIFGAKIYSGNFAMAIELYYYIPSHPDYLYREGDFRGSTGERQQRR
jgi:hypothetical protein